VWGSGIGALGIDRESRTAGGRSAASRTIGDRSGAGCQLQELQNQIKCRVRIE